MQILSVFFPTIFQAHMNEWMNEMDEEEVERIIYMWRGGQLYSPLPNVDVRVLNEQRLK